MLHPTTIIVDGVKGQDPDGHRMTFRARYVINDAVHYDWYTGHAYVTGLDLETLESLDIDDMYSRVELRMIRWEDGGEVRPGSSSGSRTPRRESPSGGRGTSPADSRGSAPMSISSGSDSRRGSGQSGSGSPSAAIGGNPGARRGSGQSGSSSAPMSISSGSNSKPPSRSSSRPPSRSGDKPSSRSGSKPPNKSGSKPTK
ncbi:hypothetical protein VTH82DRAFT_2156 [Thermothelomyces myriococcoides]